MITKSSHVYLVAGDVGETRDFTLENAPSLSGATVTPIINFGELKIELTAEVIDPDLKRIRVSYGGVSGWLATVARSPDVWAQRYRLVLPGDQLMTYPDEEPDYVHVSG